MTEPDAAVTPKPVPLAAASVAELEEEETVAESAATIKEMCSPVISTVPTAAKKDEALAEPAGAMASDPVLVAAAAAEEEGEEDDEEQEDVDEEEVAEAAATIKGIFSPVVTTAAAVVEKEETVEVPAAAVAPKPVRVAAVSAPELEEE
ncbi:unnamed protein product, partial [Pylaiella littoralis]